MFDFSNLDLSKAQEQGGVLEPGRYDAKIIKAEVVNNKNGNGKNLKVLFGCRGKSITAHIVLAHTNAKAAEIGLDKLYTMLVRAHHPSPRHPGSINSLWGLEVGIVVIDENGYPTVSGFYEIRDKGNSEEPAPTAGSDEEDAIPF